MFRTASEINKAGAKAIIVMQCPEHSMDVIKGLSRPEFLPGRGPDWRSSQGRHMYDTAAMRAVAARSRSLEIEFLDPAPLFADGDAQVYKVAEDGVPLYSDEHHLTTAAVMRFIYPWLKGHLSSTQQASK